MEQNDNTIDLQTRVKKLGMKSEVEEAQAAAKAELEALPVLVEDEPLADDLPPPRTKEDEFQRQLAEAVAAEAAKRSPEGLEDVPTEIVDEPTPEPQTALSGTLEPAKILSRLPPTDLGTGTVQVQRHVVDRRQIVLTEAEKDAIIRDFVCQRAGIDRNEAFHLDIYNRKANGDTVFIYEATTPVED